MKNYLLFAFLFVAMISFDSCKDDDDDDGLCKPDVGGENFYRIEALGEIDVIPDKHQVRLLTRVTDEEGVGVSTLDIDDFVIMENCEDKFSDVEAVKQIDRQTIPVKVKTVLLLDISKSMEGQIDEMIKGVNSLIDKIKTDQELAIVTFSRDVETIHDFSSDKTSLKEKVAQIPHTGLESSTNLHEAITEGAATWKDKFEVDGIEFGNMIVFTDGKHNAGGLTKEDVKKLINDKALFVAALESSSLDRESLLYLAGSEKNYALATDIAKLANVFDEIQEKIEREANSMYFLTYTSPISVSGQQELMLYLKDNKNGGGDNHVRKYFSSEGF